jgi:hypothetical protein
MKFTTRRNKDAANHTLRYWVSWYSGYYSDEGCSGPPFQVWISGCTDRNDASGRDVCTMCAVIDATDEKAIWEVVAKHFPDYRPRFCETRADNYRPGDRFPGFENRTSLYRQ